MKKFFTRLRLKYQLSRGQLIEVNSSYKGIGKTTMLIKRSLKKDMPILVGSQKEIDEIKRVNPNIKVYGYAPNFTKHLRGIGFPNGVLIDETVKREMVEHLQKTTPNAIKIQGGFLGEE
jgi:hypothetical protein